MKFQQGDIRKLSLGTTFDVGIAMFNVMGYMRTSRDFENAIQNIHDHLRKGGLFIFDFWNGDAVLKEGPSIKKKVIKSGDTVITKGVIPQIDNKKRLVWITHRVRISADRLSEEFEEKHSQRFYFVDEIKKLLVKHDFDLQGVWPTLEIGRTPTDRDWNLVSVAKRKN